MDVNITNVSLCLPFGRHKDKPLGEVPADYLRWALRECRLSSGLHLAVSEELRRRGIDVPPPPPPRPLRRCPDHPQAALVCRWFEDAQGRRRIRADCSRCQRYADYPPVVPPYTTEADKNASPTPVLDALLWLERLGIELESDGRTVKVPWRDWRRVPAELHALIRQGNHQLTRMLGNNIRTSP
jgi:hypothetical protein